jgi:hypothetical protein
MIKLSLPGVRTHSTNSRLSPKSGSAFNLKPKILIIQPYNAVLPLLHKVSMVICNCMVPFSATAVTPVSYLPHPLLVNSEGKIPIQPNALLPVVSKCNRVVSFQDQIIYLHTRQEHQNERP